MDPLDSAWNWNLDYDDFASGFRADDGFVPQVGYREASASSARFFRPAFSRACGRSRAPNPSTARAISSRGLFPRDFLSSAVGPPGEIDYNFEAVRIDGQTLEFNRLVWNLRVALALGAARHVRGDYGEQPDVSNVRVGTGGSLSYDHDRPTDHLALDLSGSGSGSTKRWTAQGASLHGDVARAKATYVFNARMYFRLIGQYIETTRDPSLWTFPVSRRKPSSPVRPCSPTSSTGRPCSSSVTATTAPLREPGSTPPPDRQFLLKVSYAFQR